MYSQIHTSQNSSVMTFDIGMSVYNHRLDHRHLSDERGRLSGRLI